MRLDELKYNLGREGSPWDANPAAAGKYYVWRSPSGLYTIYDRSYTIYDRSTVGTGDRWEDLDALTAQAVLFELCPVNPLNQNRTTELYLDPNNSPETSDT